MQKCEARKLIERGYYGDTMETDEVLGLIYQWFPGMDMDRDLEEIVADALYGN